MTPEKPTPSEAQIRDALDYAEAKRACVKDAADECIVILAAALAASQERAETAERTLRSITPTLLPGRGCWTHEEIVKAVADQQERVRELEAALKDLIGWGDSMWVTRHGTKRFPNECLATKKAKAALNLAAAEGKCEWCENGIIRSLGRDNDEVIEDCPKCRPTQKPDAAMSAAQTKEGV